MPKNKSLIRAWRPPARPEGSGPVAANQWAEFRAAVIQNAYAVHLRQHKNSRSPNVTREMLADDDDDRPDASSKWTRRLNGGTRWNLDDTAVVLLHYPGAMPDWNRVQEFLNVATGVSQPPTDWPWPDTMGPPQPV